MTRLLTAFSLLLVTCVAKEDLTPEVQLRALKDLSNGFFGVELFRNISRDEKNVFFSPLSVSTVMSQIYLGTKGDTRTEVGLLGYLILDVFKINIPKTYQRLYNQLRSTSDYKLEIANALVTQADFEILDEYRNSLQHYYDALIKEVDFIRDNEAAVGEVNDWVNQKTHGKIPSLVDTLDPSTRLVLLNAIYFKGTWKTQFEPEMTKNQAFYNNGGENSVSVPMMHLNTRFPYVDDFNRRLKVLQLPYKGNDISMLIVLPYERDGVARLRNEIYDLTDYLDYLDLTRVIVSIPKFKLEYSRKLKEDFKKFGIRGLFNSSADLSGINGKKDLYVSEIIHKAKIEVNEEGSEAAAVTGGFISNRIRPMPTIINEFVADHPFLFYIIHNKSKMILFVGSVDEL